MITQAELKHQLHYNPETGVFTRLISNNNNIKVGSTAGCLGGRGYWLIFINNKRYLSHRLAWLYVYGNFPNNHIDHINGIKDDNRIENLRDVTAFINHQNIINHKKNNSLNALGVTLNKRAKNIRYIARILVNGKKKWLGTFKTIEEAKSAYFNAKKIYHDGFIEERLKINLRNRFEDNPYQVLLSRD